MLRHKILGTRGKRQPYGLLPPKVAKQPAGRERNEPQALAAPAVTIERPGLCPKPRQARREASPLWHRREACALWALGPEGVNAIRRWGSETMSTTVREVQMMEQLMIPLHPVLWQQSGFFHPPPPGGVTGGVGGRRKPVGKAHYRRTF